MAPAHAGDARVTHDPTRRDWIELTIADRRDVEALRSLFAQAIAANGG